MIAFRNIDLREFKKIAADCPFLLRMNVVLDVGNAEFFLKKRPVVFLTFMENEEE